MSDMRLAIKLDYDGKAADGGVSISRENLKRLGTDARAAGEEASRALTSTSESAAKLLDKYDAQGAKLRQLRADFAALDQAARSGSIAGKDDTRLDQVYTTLKKEIGAAEVAATGMGVANAAAFRKVEEGATRGMLATVGAKRELMVLGHEAMSGNFSKMPGSFMVLAERMDLTTALCSPMAIGFASLAAVAVVVGKAFHDGTEEMKAMNMAISSTSNFAGTTRGMMEGLAEDMAKTGAITVGQAKDVVTALVSSGKIGAESLTNIAGLAAQYAKATGEDVDKIGPQLVKLFADPAKGAEELNSRMHFLGIAELERINTLVKTGQVQEAQNVLAVAAQKHLDTTTEKVGYLTSAWRAVAGKASEAWDAMMGMGKEATLEKQIAALKIKINTSGGMTETGDVVNGDTTALKAELAIKEKLLETQKLAAIQQGIDTKERAQGLAAEKSIQQATTYRIEALRKERQDVKDFGEDSINKRQRLLELDKEIASLQRGMGNDGYQTAVGKVRDQLAKEIELYKGYENDIEVLRKSGEMGDEEALIAHFAVQELKLESEAAAAQKTLELSLGRTAQEKVEAQRRLDIAKARIDAQASLEAKGYAELEANNKKFLAEIAAAAGKSLDPVTAALSKFESQFGVRMRKAASDGNREITDALEGLKGHMVGDAQFKAAKQEFDALFTDMQTQLEAVRMAADNAGGGLFAAINAGEKTDEIRNKLLPALDEAKRKMDGFATSPENSNIALEYTRKLQKTADETNQYWKKISENIGQGLSGALEKGFEDGHWSGKKFIRSIQDDLKKAAFKMTIQATVNGLMGFFGGSASSAGGGAAGSSSSLFGMASNANSVYNAFGTGGTISNAYGGYLSATSEAALGAEFVGPSATLANGATGWGAQAGSWLSGGTAATSGAAYAGTASAAAGGALGTEMGAVGAASLATEGGAMAGLGSALAAIPVWGWIAMAVIAAIAAFGGKGGLPKVNMNTGFTGTGTGTTDHLVDNGTTTYGGGQEEFKKALWTDTIQSIVAKYAPDTAYAVQLAGHINIEGKSNNQNFAAVTTSSTFAGPDDAVNTAGTIYNNHNPSFGKGIEDFKKWAAEEIPRLQLAVVTDAFRTAGGDIKDIANAVMGDAQDITAVVDAMSGADATGTITALQGIISVFDAIKTNINSSITGKATIALGNMAGGFANLTTKISDYFANYTSEEEKAAIAREQVAQQFADANLAMPETREAFRALVKSLDLTTDAGQKSFLSLMDLEGAFASITSNAEALAAKETETANARAALEIQIMRASGDEAAAVAAERQIELAAMDESLRPLQARIYALNDEAAAMAKAKAAEEARIAALKKSAEDALQILANAVDKQRAASQAQYDAQLAIVAAQKSAAQTVYEQQTALIQTSIGGAQRIASVYQSVADNIWNAAGNMRPEGMDAALNADARGRLSDYVKAGTVPTGDVLQSLLRDATNIKSEDFASQADYLSAFYQTKSDIETLGAKASRQASESGSQVTLLEQQLQAAEEQYKVQQDVYAAAEKQAADQLDATNKGFDALILAAQDQLSEAAGTKLAVMSLSDALANFTSALALYAKASKTAVETTLPTLPAFAAGGYHAGGYALVGEEGPELAYFDSPATIYNASNTRSIGSQSNADLVAEVRALRAEMSELRRSSAATASATERGADLWHAISNGGGLVQVEIV